MRSTQPFQMQTHTERNIHTLMMKKTIKNHWKVIGAGLLGWAGEGVCLHACMPGHPPAHSSCTASNVRVGCNKPRKYSPSLDVLPLEIYPFLKNTSYCSSSGNCRLITPESQTHNCLWVVTSDKASALVEVMSGTVWLDDGQSKCTIFNKVIRGAPYPKRYGAI